MHFRFLDDFVGLAPGASPEFRLEAKTFSKYYSTMTFEKFLDNLYKIRTKIKEHFAKI